MFQSRLAIPILAALVASCAGCGDGDGRVPVEGTITLDGQPLAGVHVLFDQPDLSPNENIGYLGVTDESGRYELRPAMGEGSGVPPGEYRVSLTTAVADRSAPPAQPPRGRSSSPFLPDVQPVLPERIPPAYRGGKLTFTVPEDGTDTANFDLKSR